MSKKVRLIWLVLGIIFFLGFLYNCTVAVSTDFGVLGSGTRPRSDNMVGYSKQHGIYEPKADGETVRLLDVATVYTNLTPATYLVAPSNDSLLNVRGHWWIKAHRNISTNKGDFFAGELFYARLHDADVFTLKIYYDDVYFQVKLRFVSNAGEIPDLRDDVEKYIEPKIGLTTAILWIVEGLLCGIPALAIVGKMRMERL